MQYRKARLDEVQEVAHICNRQTQVKKLTRECIGKL